MKKESSKTGNSVPKTLGTVHVPMKTTAAVASTTARGGGGERSYEKVSRYSYGDKQTGSYQRDTTREKASTGEFQWKNGTSGVKNELKTSSTVRVGDKDGYTEVYKEERFRDVRFDSKSAGGGYSGGKDAVSYDHSDGDSGSDDDDDDYSSYDSSDDDDDCGGYDSSDDDDCGGSDIDGKEIVDDGSDDDDCGGGYDSSDEDCSGEYDCSDDDYYDDDDSDY